LFPPSRRPRLSNHITLIASGKGRRSETVGAKLGASPGPNGPQVGPIVRFVAFAIFFPEQVRQPPRRARAWSLTNC